MDTHPKYAATKLLCARGTEGLEAKGNNGMWNSGVFSGALAGFGFGALRIYPCITKESSKRL